MYNICSHGVATWADLFAPEGQAPVDFYAELLGWTVAPRRTPGSERWIGSAGGVEVAGLLPTGPDRDLATGWTVFFEVADVAEAVEAVRHVGGVVLEVPFAFPDGRAAIVADPGGAVLGLVSGRRRRRWLSNTAGAVCWVEVATPDLPVAERFYAAVLGWKAQPSHHGASYTTFVRDGEFVAGGLGTGDVATGAGGEGPSAGWSVYFVVEDCAAGERRAEELGGAVVRPTTDLGVGRFAVLADPVGARFQLIETAT